MSWGAAEIALRASPDAAPGIAGVKRRWVRRKRRAHFYSTKMFAHSPAMGLADAGIRDSMVLSAPRSGWGAYRWRRLWKTLAT